MLNLYKEMSTPIAPAYKPEFPLPCSSPIWKRVSAGGEASKDLLIIRRRSTTGLTGAGIGYSPVVNHEPSRIASDNTAGGEFSTDEEPEDGRPRGSTSPRVDSASRFASISKDVTSARTKASPGSVDSSTASERNRSDAENVKEEPRKLPSQRSDSPSASGNTSKNETSALETTSLDTTVSSIASADNGLLAKVGDQAARPRWYCDGCGQASHTYMQSIYASDTVHRRFQIKLAGCTVQNVPAGITAWLVRTTRLSPTQCTTYK